jgi:hypothetical protein
MVQPFFGMSMAMPPGASAAKHRGGNIGSILDDIMRTLV